MSELSNYSIRDEIREFWSERAATFDQSVGHEVFSEDERRGWHRLIRKHLGEGNGRPLLDMACGTAVISHLMHDMGFKVTGLDWSEAMLAQARAKAQARGTDIAFIMRDAERTGEPDGKYAAITNRHLVWTLVDVPAAFAEWHRLLQPGGRLLIVDGNMGKPNWVAQLHGQVDSLLGRPPAKGHMDPAMQARHKRIREQVYFRDGMPAEAVVALLEAAGFVEIEVDRRLWDIHWAQARKSSFWRGAERLASDRFAICARKPG
ncbi:class I SAM-dependent methyltransferase [Devosia sp. FKR38]|uniref:class I SAM-dependent methyltransferase n=1 Tax=Devosia sp. FKR38 TaxID=2562312 RepID=UPI0010C08197|nr:class I SAM-dependent methyltransferase [Devosia sp. FKR38]